MFGVDHLFRRKRLECSTSHRISPHGFELFRWQFDHKPFQFTLNSIPRSWRCFSLHSTRALSSGRSSGIPDENRSEDPAARQSKRWDWKIWKPSSDGLHPKATERDGLLQQKGGTPPPDFGVPTPCGGVRFNMNSPPTLRPGRWVSTLLGPLRRSPGDGPLRRWDPAEGSTLGRPFRIPGEAAGGGGVELTPRLVQDSGHIGCLVSFSEHKWIPFQLHVGVPDLEGARTIPVASHPRPDETQDYPGLHVTPGLEIRTGRFWKFDGQIPEFQSGGLARPIQIWPPTWKDLFLDLWFHRFSILLGHFLVGRLPPVLVKKSMGEEESMRWTWRVEKA